MFCLELPYRIVKRGPWNSGRNLFLSLTKVLGSATSSGFEVQRNWSHPSRQLNQFVADILWRSLLLPCDNVRCMVVNGNLVSRLIGVVGQALRFSGERQVQGLGWMAMLSAAVASCHQQKLSQNKQCTPIPLCFL